jgi:hypothetical protein
VDIYKNEYEKIVETTITIDEQNNSKSSKSESTHDNFELNYKNLHKESDESDIAVMEEFLLKWGTFRYN